MLYNQAHTEVFMHVQLIHDVVYEIDVIYYIHLETIFLLKIISVMLIMMGLTIHRK